MVLVLIALAAGGGFWFGRSHHADPAAESDHEPGTTQAADEEKPVATVSVAPLKRGTIVATINAYGSVTAQSGDVRVISVPFESRIVRELVTPGQPVAAGAELVQLTASPDALIALEEAKQALAAAEQELARVKQRFADRLATNTELAAADQTYQSARLKLNSLTQRGVGTEQTLKAESAGIVGKVDVQEGQIVPAGGALVEIASGNRIEVDLGVEPGDAATLKAGEPVKLRPVGQSDREPLAGAIRVIGQRVDPATRLISVRITPPADAHLMLETFVTGEIERSAADALIVPRDAVLADEGEHVVFTVKDNHAVKHKVKVGLENSRQTQVIAEDLKEGDPIVVLGNYELEDGVEVKAQEQKEQPAIAPSPPSSAPTTRETAP
jgi:RND family efflux transporter MFP subunit